MSKKRLVVYRETCPMCGGSGWVANPELDELWERFLVERKRGGYNTFYDFLKCRGLNPEDLPEVIPCQNCGGSGSVKTEIHLRIVLTDPRAVGKEEV